MSHAAPADTLRAADAALLRHHAERWHAEPDGDAFGTASSILQPVLWPPARGGAPLRAMLKVARPGEAGDEERAGFALQQWWSGVGAATVYARDEGAVLLERALGRRSLTAMASRPSAADDDHALRLLCQSVARLHEPRQGPTPPLVPLEQWFSELFEHADAGGGGYLRGADLAAELLDEPGEAIPLHGDVHHGNVLDFGERGWLAIDPKALLGARGFDYANMLCNPSPVRAARPAALARRVQTVALASGITADSLLRWTIAWTALSATWHQSGDDDEAAAQMLAVGDTATRLLLDG